MRVVPYCCLHPVSAAPLMDHIGYRPLCEENFADPTQADGDRDAIDRTLPCLT